MNVNKVVIGSLLALAVIIAIISGYRYVERSQTEKRLHGAWEQEDPFATFQRTAEDAQDDAPQISSIDAEDDAQDDGFAVTIPGLEEGLKRSEERRVGKEGRAWRWSSGCRRETIEGGAR